MSESIRLLGADDVYRASHNIQQATENMSRTADRLEELVCRLDTILNQVIDRLEGVMKP